MNFSSAVAWIFLRINWRARIFFHFIFPCANIFFVLRPPPPISFLMVRPLDHVLYSLPSITWSSNYRESTVFPFRSDFFNGGNSIEPCVRLLTISTFGIWGTSRLNGILLPILTLKLLYEMSKEQRNSVLCYHYRYESRIEKYIHKYFSFYKKFRRFSMAYI